jgi:hypothetical protein
LYLAKENGSHFGNLNSYSNWRGGKEKEPPQSEKYILAQWAGYHS